MSKFTASTRRVNRMRLPSGDQPGRLSYAVVRIRVERSSRLRMRRPTLFSPQMVARSRALAEDASELIEIDIESITAVVDRAASARDAHLLFEQNGTNTAAHYVV